MINNYLHILQESLEKKCMILDQIEEKSKEQSEMIKQDIFSMENIDQNMDEKAMLISQMTQLDNGFDTLYNKIRSEIVKDKNPYKDDILKIQKLISAIMEKSSSIEALEARNKISIEEKFKQERQNLKSKKNVSNIAYNYYKTANKLDFLTPQFLDQKK